MNTSHQSDLHLKEQLLGLQLLGAHDYWHRKRLVFNVIVGISGLCFMLLFSGMGLLLRWFDLFGVIAWGMVANAFYSTGYVLDSFVIARSGGKRSLVRYRRVLFGMGTAAYVVVNYLFCAAYFLFF